MRHKILTCISFCCILVIMLIAVMPVEMSWGIANMLLAYICPIFLFVSILVSIIYKVRYRVCLIDILLFVWYLYVVVYAYIQPTYPVAYHVLTMTQLLGMYYSLRIVLNDSMHKERYIPLILIAVCFFEALFGIYQVITGNSRNNAQAMTGTFLNSGPFGIMLACGLIELFSFARKYQLNIKGHAFYEYAVMLSACIISAVLLSTASRTAILCVFIYVLYVKKKLIKKHVYKTCSFLVLLFICLFLIKPSSAIGRLTMWNISSRIFINHPFVGSGIGSFLNQYADEMSKLSVNAEDGYFNGTDVIHYAFNNIIYIGAEQGLLGVGIFILILITTLKAINKVRHIDNYIIGVLLFTSLFSYTFSLLPFLLILIVALASLFSVKICNNKKTRWNAIPILAFFLLINLLSFPHIKKRVDANVEYTSIKGNHASGYSSDYYRLFPYMQENPSFLFDFSKTLSNIRRYNDSNYVLQKGQLISADPMFYVLQGDNYEKMKEYGMAELYYNKAFCVMPNRIYPLYKLMMLYQRTGKNEKSYILARRIIAFPVKIESKATKDMKTKAAEIEKMYIDMTG